MQVYWREHITSSAEVLRGKPCIKGTRIPVSLLLGYLTAGYTVEAILGEFPDLTRDQIAACLDYARTLAEFEVAGGVLCAFSWTTAFPIWLYNRFV